MHLAQVRCQGAACCWGPGIKFKALPTRSLSACDLRTMSTAAVRAQLEHYLSDESLPRDEFLLGLSGLDGAGSVAVDVLQTFPRLQQLLAEGSDEGGETPQERVAVAVRSSSLLQLGADGQMVSRTQPLPVPEPEPQNLGEYLAWQQVGAHPLRWRPDAPDVDEAALDAAFLGWLGRVGVAEWRGSSAFRSRCAERDSKRRPEMLAAFEAARAAQEAVEAHPGVGPLLAERLAMVGLRKKVAGLLKSEKPGLEEKREAALAELSAAEARERAAVAGLGVVWEAHVEAERALTAAEAPGSDTAVAAAKGKRTSDMQRRKAGKALEKGGLPPGLLERICSCQHGREAADGRKHQLQRSRMSPLAPESSSLIGWWSFQTLGRSRGLSRGRSWGRRMQLVCVRRCLGW